MTLQHNYKKLFNSSKLTITIWGTLFGYRQPYIVAWKKLNGKLPVSNQDATIMRLVKYLINKHLLYDLILNNVELQKISENKLRNLVSVSQRDKHDKLSKCPLCEQEFRAFI